MENRTPRRLFLAAGLAVTLLFAISSPAGAADAPDPDQPIHDLFAKDKLLLKTEYKAVRAAFARRFEGKYQDLLKRAYGDDHQALTAWLDANPEVKEEFYIALDEKHDKVEAALRLFKDIWKKYPEKTKTCSNLAIAVAIVWDEPHGRSVYDYEHHAVRCKCTPLDRARDRDALANFEYVATNDKELKGYGQYLPWEFLAHVVNHRTPAAERNWTLKNYIARRPMFGECYKHVEYDNGMLRGETAKLAGHDYTLENLKKHGGVCAMQADFAARVGKSMGVPAEYVRGEGQFRGFAHAWVMWVELKQVTKDKVLFTLESYGRYDVDKYYFGTLFDPQTGQEILDRDMELRLSSVGLDRQAKRQSALAMRAFPMLRDKQRMDVSAQLKYLDKVIALWPYNEECWLALAKLSKDGVLKKEHQKTVMNYENQLFKTFAKFPDFTWKVMNDLTTVHDDLAHKTRLYDQLVKLYEGADRPDLACEARLKLAGWQTDSGKHKEAASGLAITVEKFPGEGRYVPKLMDELEKSCKNFKGGTDLLAAFYIRVLPKVPTKRGDSVSQHCVTMHEKAIAFFRQNNNDKVADQLKFKLAQVQAGGKP